MKCLVTGGGGFVGSALCQRLEGAGHTVIVLSRRRDPASRHAQVVWDYAKGLFDCGSLLEDGLDAVVHLAGENVAGGRWNDARKQRIHDSRVAGTRFLIDSLRAHAVPKVFLAASAIGFYGERHDELLTENSAPGEGFLADLALEWEGVSTQFERDGVRVGLLRFGIVLDADGGALGKMLPLFRSGLGGPLGGGDQWMSWIVRSDAARAVEFILHQPNLSGVFNLSAPNPVTNREFSATLGEVLGRPAVLPAPAFALRLLLGEMADALLLHSQRVVPEKLLKAGFEFDFPELKEALVSVLDPAAVEVG